MTDYRPSPTLENLLSAYRAAQEALEGARQALRAGVADELKANEDVTSDKLAEHLPWTGETVRGIAREYGVPHKRKPTVRSIKPKRRSTT